MKQDLYKICSILVIITAMVSFIYACKDTLEDSRKTDLHRLEPWGNQEKTKINNRIVITQGSDFIGRLS